LQEDGGTRQEILKQLAVKLELALLIYIQNIIAKYQSSKFREDNAFLQPL